MCENTRTCKLNEPGSIASLDDGENARTHDLLRLLVVTNQISIRRHFHVTTDLCMFASDYQGEFVRARSYSPRAPSTSAPQSAAAFRQGNADFAHSHARLLAIPLEFNRLKSAASFVHLKKRKGKRIDSVGSRPRRYAVCRVALDATTTAAAREIPFPFLPLCHLLPNRCVYLFTFAFLLVSHGRSIIKISCYFSVCRDFYYVQARND